MHRAEDAEILQFARDDSRVCVTLDHDFHAHLAATGHGRPSANRPNYFTAIVTPTVVTVDVWPLVVAITDSGKKRKAPCA